MDEGIRAEFSARGKSHHNQSDKAEKIHGAFSKGPSEPNFLLRPSIRKFNDSGLLETCPCELRFSTQHFQRRDTPS